MFHAVLALLLITETLSALAPAGGANAMPAAMLNGELGSSEPSARDFDHEVQRALMSYYRNLGSPIKRASHQVEARSMNQFKNCYFSPVQCVLLERRRR